MALQYIASLLCIPTTALVPSAHCQWPHQHIPSTRYPSYFSLHALLAAHAYLIRRVLTIIYNRNSFVFWLSPTSHTPTAQQHTPPTYIEIDTPAASTYCLACMRSLHTARFLIRPFSLSALPVQASISLAPCLPSLSCICIGVCKRDLRRPGIHSCAISVSPHTFSLLRFLVRSFSLSALVVVQASISLWLPLPSIRLLHAHGLLLARFSSTLRC